jgi:membrane protease YdiL (CAAX protease family)
MLLVAQALFGMFVYLLVAASLGVWAAIVSRLQRRQPLVRFEPRIPVPWNGMDLAVLLVTIVYAEMVAAGISTHYGGAPRGELSAVGLGAAAVARLAWVAFAAMYLTLMRGAFLDDLGLRSDKIKNDVQLGILGFLAAVLPVYGLQLLLTRLLEIPSEHPIVTFAAHEPHVLSLILAGVVAAIVAPVGEEFLFRVVLQGWLEKKKAQAGQLGDGSDVSPGMGPAIVVSALFAALHLGHGPDPIPLFFLSLILGYLYQRTHRIVAPLTVHFCVNSLAVVQLGITWAAGPAAG